MKTQMMIVAVELVECKIVADGETIELVTEFNYLYNN